MLSRQLIAIPKVECTTSMESDISGKGWDFVTSARDHLAWACESRLSRLHRFVH